MAIHMHKNDVEHLPDMCKYSMYVRAVTINLLQENTGVDLYDLGFDSGILDMTPKAQRAKEKQVTQTLSKFKTFVYQRTSSRK